MTDNNLAKLVLLIIRYAQESVERRAYDGRTRCSMIWRALGEGTSSEEEAVESAEEVESCEEESSYDEEESSAEKEESATRTDEGTDVRSATAVQEIANVFW